MKPALLLLAVAMPLAVAGCPATIRVAVITKYGDTDVGGGEPPTYVRPQPDSCVRYGAGCQ